MNAMHTPNVTAFTAILTASMLSCSLCPASSDPHNSCPSCNRSMCSDCTCACDHVTSEHALAAALQALWNDFPNEHQTLLVQDEFGSFYASSGPVAPFLNAAKPTYEGEVVLNPELHDLFTRYQEFAAHTQDQKNFDTEHYSAMLRPFILSGRVFTVSLIKAVV